MKKLLNKICIGLIIVFVSFLFFECVPNEDHPSPTGSPGNDTGRLIDPLDEDVDVKIRETGAGLLVELDFPEVRIEEIVLGENVFHSLNVPSCGIEGEIGQPLLPAKSLTFEIPYGVDVEIDITQSDYQTLDGLYHIIPRQPPLRGPKGDAPAHRIEFQYSQQIYSQDTFLPAQPVYITDKGFIRERRFITVAAVPVQYKPYSQLLQTTSKLVFEINYIGTSDPHEASERARLSNPAFDTLSKSTLQNIISINDASTNSSRRLNSNETGGELLRQSSIQNLSLPTLQALPSSNALTHVDYLIITADSFENEMEPFAQWKRKKGYRTEIVTLGLDLGSSNTDIKNFLQNAFDNWATPPTFVLLVGDKEHIPTFEVSRPIPSPSGPIPGTSYDFLSDHPYSLLSGTDQLPDIFLGRLYVSTQTQVTDVVNKILRYEMTTDATSGWQENVLIAGFLQDKGDPNYLFDPATGDRTSSIHDCEEDYWFFDTTTYVMDFLENVLHKNVYYSFTTDAYIGGNCTSSGPTPMQFNSLQFSFQKMIYPNSLTAYRAGTMIQPDLINLIDNANYGTPKIIDAFDNGIGLALYRGHGVDDAPSKGVESGWHNPYFRTPEIGGLARNNKTPVVLSLTCETGRFKADSFAVKLLQQPNAGAVGVIAATLWTDSGYNDFLAHGYMTSLWPKKYDPSYSGSSQIQPSAQIGPATAFSKFYMRSHYPAGDSYTIDQYMKFHVLGDPEMMIHTDTFVTPIVAWPSSLVEGASNITIQCNMNGARIGVSQNDAFLGSAIVSSGQAVIPFVNSVASGNVTIVVTGRNLKSLEQDIPTTRSGDTTIIYSEGFENGAGNWRQGSYDDLDWEPRSGAVPSITTGPTGPSGAYEGSGYMYVESSTPNFPNKLAILNSPTYNLNGLLNPLFSFRYYMYGAAMGSLDLEVSVNGGSWTSAWHQSGNQGQMWYQADVDLSAYTGNVVRLRFVGETGGSFTSDIAIDDITLSTTTASTNCSTTISNFPYSEGFENGLGNWRQSSSDDLDWENRTGAVPSITTGPTGPSAAYEGSYYRYIESSTPNFPDKTAILESPCFDLNGLSSIALFSFRYYMYGAAMGSLDLEVSVNGGSWTSAWHQSGNQGQMWYQAFVNLSAYAGNMVQLRFVGETGSSFTSDIAIDDITLGVI